MTCYGAGTAIDQTDEACCSAGIPDGIPPDQTNM
jgi:hypothetical protein